MPLIGDELRTILGMMPTRDRAGIARGTMAACRDHGEVRLEGKEYVVQDGDIINFRFAT